ncbi:hypothetical protein CPB83DRAFT_901498 [Crepidotus variabilis]|uniref:Ino eighty subunit 1 n=1 Tax=Crepidotus variabilis TaxID=179855 RepID=A0A9P6EUL9_9AGAR|nr:hypothetical protein CPB83DRAFT_901498 [Crepidotus variabilis]
MQPSTSSQGVPSWPSENSPVSYLSRKALPIKRNDAEPLTREDVQYDLLNSLFTDPRAVFTNPGSTKQEKVAFGDLYVSALYSSNRCSKVLKEKMHDTPAFSVEFAKIALLTNVGRINTTMAFFPEMKTALRTYHPVPSLQKTDGNAQDAPRIKNCLKAALLPTEVKSTPPSTPEEVLTKLRAGQRPPTSVVNLIFVLANHAAPLSQAHFDHGLNFLDLFLPNTLLATEDRAKVFLWLIYHYLENDTAPNPFDDQYSSKNVGKVPLIRKLTPTEYERENVDSPDEIEWGKKMSQQRNQFLQKLVVEAEKKTKPHAHYVTESGNNMPRSQRQLLDEPPDERSFLFYVPSQENAEPQRAMKNYIRPSPTEGERTMFEQAWHMAKTLDPLIDSDDEEVTDYNTRVDFGRYSLAPNLNPGLLSL